MSIPIPFSPAHSLLIGNEEGVKKKGEARNEGRYGIELKEGREEEKGRNNASHSPSPFRRREGREGEKDGIE